MKKWYKCPMGIKMVDECTLPRECGHGHCPVEDNMDKGGICHYYACAYVGPSDRGYDPYTHMWVIEDKDGEERDYSPLMYDWYCAQQKTYPHGDPYKPAYDDIMG